MEIRSQNQLDFPFLQTFSERDSSLSDLQSPGLQTFSENGRFIHGDVTVPSFQGLCTALGLAVFQNGPVVTRAPGGRLPPGVQVAAEALSAGLVCCDIAFPVSCPQRFAEYHLPSVVIPSPPNTCLTHGGGAPGEVLAPCCLLSGGRGGVGECGAHSPEPAALLGGSGVT